MLNKTRVRNTVIYGVKIALIISLVILTSISISLFPVQASDYLWGRDSFDSAVLSVSVKFEDNDWQSPHSRFNDPVFLNSPEFSFDSDLLEINIINPTLSQVEPDVDIVNWTLQTNGWNVNLDFESVGDDGQSYGNLVDDYTNEFFKYTIFDDFETFGSFFPGGGLYGLNFDGGTHPGKIKIEYNPAFSDKPWCAVRAGEYRDIIMVTISGEPGDYRTETAFGGDTGVNVRNPERWWYYFATKKGEVQNIWAGQDEYAGTVWVRKTNNNWEINFYFDNGWQLINDREAVKIKGYQEKPDEMPPSGKLDTYKGSYEGSDSPISFSDNSYRYFIIHLDLIKFY